MTPLEASSIFATLVGLLCNWKQERGAMEQDRFQSFLIWLTNHQHNELLERIQQSRLLQDSLGELLRSDRETLSAKLDSLSQGLSSLANQLTSFAPIRIALGEPKAELSEQALVILKLFDQLGHPRLLVLDPHPERTNSIAFLPCGEPFRLRDWRFVEGDVSQLQRFGFVSLVDGNGDGQPIYALTRSGSKFAKELPDIDLGNVKQATTGSI